MQRFFGFVMGIVSGALIGGAVALLMAPSAGEELRGQIRGRSLSFVDEIKDAAKERQLELEEHLAALRAPRSAHEHKDN